MHPPTHRLQRVAVHPAYNGASQLNDVAIIVLKLPIYTIKPVQLPPVPTATVRQQAIPPGTLLYVAGWGKTDTAEWSPALR